MTDQGWNDAVRTGHVRMDAEHQVELAKVTIRQARGEARTTDLLEVKSPVDGTVLRTFQEGGGVVQLATPLAELGDPSALEVVVDVLSADAIRIPLK